MSGINTMCVTLMIIKTGKDFLQNHQNQVRKFHGKLTQKKALFGLHIIHHIHFQKVKSYLKV